MVTLIIITGVYGAGKTSAAQAFEEAGFYVTDNVPLEVVDKYFDEIEKHSDKYPKVVLTVEHEYALETYNLAKTHKNFDVKFLGITCDAATINSRYRLTRKLHPKQTKGVSLEKAIQDDIEALRKLRDYFDFYIDTAKLSKSEFRSRVYDAFIGSDNKFTVVFSSFGYKVAVPQDIETVFDVRLLPNPYWDPNLREKTGLDEEVKKYVLEAPETKDYLKHIIEYLDFYLEALKNKGRNHAHIGIACSGGQHRSVVIAEYLYEHYSKKYHTSLTHKDIPTK